VTRKPVPFNCSALLLFWQACGLDPGPSKTMAMPDLKPLAPPCRTGNPSGEVLDEQFGIAICDGSDERVACSDEYTACSYLTDKAAVVCEAKAGVYIGARTMRASGTLPTLSRCYANVGKLQQTAWPACGKYVRTSNWYELVWPCTGFAHSLDCEYMDDPHCQALPASLGAKTMCCRRRSTL